MSTKWIRKYIIPILFLGLAGAILWTYTSVREEPVNEPAGEVTLSILPDYGVVSGKDITVWPKGTSLPQGMASYFFAAEPKVILTPTLRLSGQARASLDTRIKSRIILQSVDDKGQLYWQYQLREIPEQTFLLSQGMPGQADQKEYQAADIRLEVYAAYQLVNRIGEELMDQTGTIQLMVNSEVTVFGSINDIPLKETLTQALPITLQQTGFTLPKTEEAEVKHTLVEGQDLPGPWETLAVTITEHPLQFGISGFIIVLISLLLVITRSKSKTAAEHKRYREWITEGSVEVEDRMQIYIHELEGLVDLAIDMDRRVIYDSRLRRYYVLTEDMVYVYDPEHLRGILDHKQQLGRLLVEQRLINPEQLEIGLYYQKKIGRRLGESLIALGFIDETTLYSTLAAQHKLDYYELDPKSEIHDTEWLSKMNIREARALISLPLGRRADGIQVIASGETSREGIKNILEEIFGADIYLVFARPSAIHVILDLIEAKEREKLNIIKPENGQKATLNERLTEDERGEFKGAYYRGHILSLLLLKALRLVDTAILSEIPAKEDTLGWLVNKNIINSGLAGLIQGVGKAVETMEFKARQEKQIPGILEVLTGANFITEATVEWITKEAAIQGLPIDRLLLDNYLISESTLNHINVLFGTIESILKNYQGQELS